MPNSYLSIFILVLYIVVALPACSQPGTQTAQQADGRYQIGKTNRDGIGKFYMGREISHVMGFQGAAWLERTTREVEERTDLLVENLPLMDDAVVADIGAGTGYFAFRIAQRVPNGKVLAVDIQQEMLDIIAERKKNTGVTNIELIRGTIESPNLPANAVDLVLIVDVYHEMSHPYEVMTGVVESLKPGGKVILIEYRAEDPTVPIKRLHKMSQAQAKKEMEAVGLAWKETKDFLPQQHFLVFEKP